MLPNLIDHLIAAVLVFVVPWLVIVDYRKLVRAVEAGRPGARRAAYRETIVVQWSFAAFVVGFWVWSGRALTSLGLGLDASRGLWMGLGLTLALCAFLVFQTVMVNRHAEARAAVRAQIGSLRPLLPHTAGEGHWFTAVSLTAGTCEEVIYRGFLMAYLGPLGVVAAIVLSTLIFSLSHAYMGRMGAIRAGLVGLVVAGLYWLTGSLWASMLLHATADVTSGIMARRSFGDLSGGDGACGPPRPPSPAGRR